MRQSVSAACRRGRWLERTPLRNGSTGVSGTTMFDDVRSGRSAAAQTAETEQAAPQRSEHRRQDVHADQARGQRRECGERGRRKDPGRGQSDGDGAQAVQ